MSKIIAPGQNPNVSADKNKQMAELVQMIKNSTSVKCDDCESSNFIEVVRVRKVSGLVSRLGREMLIPIAVYACASCGWINEMFMKSSGLNPDDEEQSNIDDEDVNVEPTVDNTETV